MKLKPEAPSKTPDISDLSAAELRPLNYGRLSKVFSKN
ncbi:hypothetical protein MRBBS_0073 [Marinobacter sp. BSs20148]|nr:hypothetical protein MRBBS_0073 [Marinobacter sp. BSs20148]